MGVSWLRGSTTDLISLWPMFDPPLLWGVSDFALSLIFVGRTYPQTYPKINLAVSLHKANSLPDFEEYNGVFLVVLLDRLDF